MKTINHPSEINTGSSFRPSKFYLVHLPLDLFSSNKNDTYAIDISIPMNRKTSILAPLLLLLIGWNFNPDFPVGMSNFLHKHSLLNWITGALLLTLTEISLYKKNHTRSGISSLYIVLHRNFISHCLSISEKLFLRGLLIQKISSYVFHPSSYLLISALLSVSNINLFQT